MIRLEGADLVQGQLRRLAMESQTTVRDGLGRLAFEVRDALAAHVAESLQWSGPSTRRFISGAFRVKYRTQEGLFSAEIYPMPASAKLIARHTAAHTNLPGQRADLQVRGKLAVPVPGVIPRGRSGKVPARLLPAALLARDSKGRSKGFINRAGTAIMYRTRGGDPVPAYALRPRTQQRARIDLAGTAARAVTARAPVAFAAAIARARRNAGLR